MPKYNLHDELGQFTAIPEAVIEMIPDIGSDAALLYLYFRYRTNRKRGSAWPGYDRICKDLNWGRQKVSNNIKVLESANLVERKKRYGQSTIYILKRPPDIGEEIEETPSSTETVRLEENENPQKYENNTPLVRKSYSSSTETVLKPDVLKPNILNQTHKKRGNRPPAVELCKRINFRYPHKSLWKTINLKVGSEFISLLKWGRILRHWKLSGWNPTNYKGMLEVFDNGWRKKAIPERRRSGYEIVKEMLNDGRPNQSDISPTDSTIPLLETRARGGESIFDDSV